jgi:hypothetical protein
MFDYKQQIAEFLKENFEPSNPTAANFKVNSTELLNYLFQIFPADCINDYDLNEILIGLNYKRFTYEIQSITFINDENGKEKEHINYSLCFGWCLNSLKLKNILT